MTLTTVTSMKITERQLPSICDQMRKQMESLGWPEHEIRRSIAKVKQDFRAFPKGVK